MRSGNSASRFVFPGDMPRPLVMSRVPVVSENKPAPTVYKASPMDSAIAWEVAQAEAAMLADASTDDELERRLSKEEEVTDEIVVGKEVIVEAPKVVEAVEAPTASTEDSTGETRPVTDRTTKEGAGKKPEEVWDQPPLSYLKDATGGIRPGIGALVAGPLERIGKSLQDAGANVHQAVGTSPLEQAMGEADTALAESRAHAKQVELQMQKAMEAVKLAAEAEISSAREQMKAAQHELEREKERRIAHTQEMACRRILRRDISRAWQAWSAHSFYAARTQRLLRQAGTRLLRPKQAACFAHWRHDWDEAAREACALMWETEALETVAFFRAEADKEMAAVREAAAEQVRKAQEAADKAEAAAQAAGQEASVAIAMAKDAAMKEAAEKAASAKEQAHQETMEARMTAAAQVEAAMQKAMEAEEAVAKAAEAEAEVLKAKQAEAAANQAAAAARADAERMQEEVSKQASTLAASATPASAPPKRGWLRTPSSVGKASR